MEAHYTYFDSFGIHDANTQKFATALAVGLGLIVAGKLVSSRLTSRLGSMEAGEAVIPDDKFSLTSLVDALLEALINFQDSILGKENRKYFPLIGSIFLFVLISNLIGLVPGIPALTTTVWVTASVAFVIFFAFNIYGIRENGALGYLKHFAGPIWWIAWLVFPLEILGTCLRVLTLNLRLYWNITADHMVLGIFTGLVPYVVPVLFFALGTFVSVMQAFVPTVLAIIYIQMATQHDEESEHH